VNPVFTDERPTVLVVDDSPDVISLINDILRAEFRVRAASGGLAALKLLGSGKAFDLVLLDVLMADMGGYEVLRHIQQMPHLAKMPVIFLTGMAGDAEETVGLRLGAVDFIRKPINGEALLARVRNHVELKRSRDRLSRHNEELEREVERRTAMTEQIQDITILCLASLAETRDHETGHHLLRTQNYVRLLATELQHQPRFSGFLTPTNIQLLYKSAPLHDIGKVGIPDQILLKPGKLNASEFEVMQRHCAYGSDAIARAETSLGHQADFLMIAKEIAGSHHERWDGSGYPLGLKGDAIPISARLMAIADVYDALISRRCYKPPLSHRDVVPMIERAAGTHFDPEIVEAFVRHADRFDGIAKMYSEP